MKVPSVLTLLSALSVPGLAAEPAQGAGSVPAGMENAEPPLSPEARLEYEEKYLTVADEMVVIGGDSHRSPEVYQGKYRKPIDRHDFYRLVGQPERADFEEGRQRLQLGLFFGGAAALLTGGILAGVALTTEVCHKELTDPGFGDCVRQNASRDTSPPFLATALVVGGVGMVVTSLLIHPDPPAPDQMRRQADEYNRALRRRLSGTSRAAPARPPIEVHASPYAARHGGGLIVTATF
jgi:hypothetical protein